MKRQLKTILRLTAFILVILLAFVSFSPEVLADTFIDDAQAEFDAGTYANTVWDIDHVELSSGQTSGTFTSQVFDGGANASWSQILWSESLANVDKLIAVDSTADIWKSVDNGATWSLLKDDYTGDDSNNATDMVKDTSENLIILFNQDVWSSTDAGINWTKVNDDYNDSEGQNGQRIAIDSSNNLYIVEADEDVWQSTDNGASWTKAGNTGSANAAGFVGVGSDLFLVDTSANVYSSTDSGASWSLIKDDYTGEDANNADYMIANSSGHLYILFNQDVWRSTDAGVNWTKVNDDYNDSENQNGLIIAKNSSDHLFIAETDEDIWLSTDNGASWTKAGNTGGGNTLGLAFINVSTDIIFSARSGNDNPPTDSFLGSLTDSAGENPSVSDAQYFQYRASFSSEDSTITPELSSVMVTYAADAGDTTAPAAVADLALSSPSDSAMTVSWSAPGDDDSTGTATSYDLRYSTSAIISENFDSATAVTGEPTPSEVGSEESITVTGLDAETTYYFAIKTSDEVPNESALSNVPSLATLAEGEDEEEDEEESAPAPSGGGGGGGTLRRVIFSGYAYPENTIEVLRKSAADESYLQVPSESIKINDDGSFSITYIGLTGADYFFALNVKDKDSRSAGILAFNVSLWGDLFEVKDIIVPPTIGFEKAAIAKNEVMKILGYATPQNVVELEIDGSSKYKKTTADELGLWSFELDTTYLAYGEHSVRARQIISEAKASNFSLTRVFRLSKLSVLKADLNGDNVIDIRDWSVFLFRWGNEDSALRRQNDINGDGEVDIFDFSLFLQAIKI